MDVVELLSRHRTLGGAPRDELEWLAAHGELRHVERTTLLKPTGETHPFVMAGLESLIIHFSGRMVLYADHGAGPHKVMEWTGGDVNGLLPYSRMSGPGQGEMVVTDPMDTLVVNRIHFPEMIRACPAVTAMLVHVMLDRARHFRASELQDEKMKSLGKLAAGLAHELNNPASASTRSAQLLRQALAQADEAARTLRTAGLTEAQFAVLERVRETCLSGEGVSLTALERADREDALVDWLTAHDADTSAAAALTETSVGTTMLDELAATLPPTALDAAIRWVATGCSIHTLAAEIEHGTARISTLVGAVKRFTYMDRALTPEAVSVAESVNDTILLLHQKIREKSIAVAIDIGPDLLPARAIGGDLNQILMRVIDNALDASPDSGRVTISAEAVHNRVVVRIVDNGPGIPQEIRARVFDPFVTSKPVGQGVGLGLDIARQLVRRNDGDIEVDSKPGHTEFRITLLLYASDASQTPVA